MTEIFQFCTYIIFYSPFEKNILSVQKPIQIIHLALSDSQLLTQNTFGLIYLSPHPNFPKAQSGLMRKSDFSVFFIELTAFSMPGMTIPASSLNFSGRPRSLVESNGSSSASLYRQQWTVTVAPYGTVPGASYPGRLS